jgi:hypothetical protein
VASYLCTFSVGVETTKGAIDRTVTGCFVPAAGKTLVYMPKVFPQVLEGNGPATVC